MLSFARPWLLLFAVVAGGLAAASLPRALRRVGSARRAGAEAWLRGLAAALLGLAVAGPGWLGDDGQRTRVVVLDVSASFRERRHTLRHQLPGLLSDVERWGLVRYAGRAAVELAPGPWGLEAWPRLLEPDDPAGAALLEALRQARALLPRGGDIVLAGDGQGADAAVEQELAALAAAGVPVHLLCPPARRPPAVLVGLRAPPRVAPAERFHLEAVIAGPPGAEAVVELLSGGRGVAAETLALGPAGRAAASFALEAPERGPARYGVRLFDARGPLDAGEIAVAVDLSRRVLWVGADAPLVDASHVRPDELASGRVGLGEAACIVLDDVSAAGLGTPAQRALVEAVRAGAGLVVLGGDQAFGADGYVDSAIEEVLPVRLTPDADDGERSAFVFLIDKSTSMGFDGKLEQVRQAVLPPPVLGPRDRLAVYLFDVGFRQLLPLGPPPEERPAFGEAGGRTHLFPALFEAFALLEGSAAPVRHAVVLTDGRTVCTPEDTLALSAWKRRAPGLSASFVSVGAHPQTALLARLATLAGGRFVVLSDIGEGLRAVLEEETRTVLATGIQRGSFPITEAADWVAGPWPPLTALLRVEPLPDARLGLASGGEALLAVGEAGLGRVGFFASGLAPTWAPGYRTGDAGRRLVEACLEAVRPRPGVGRWSFSAVREGARVRAEARLREPLGGPADSLTLRWEGGEARAAPAGLGRWSALLPAGVSPAELRWFDPAGPRLGSCPVREPWPRERAGAWLLDRERLARLARRGGGLLRSAPPLPPPPAAPTRSDATAWCAGAALLLWLGSLALRARSAG